MSQTHGVIDTEENPYRTQAGHPFFGAPSDGTRGVQQGRTTLRCALRHIIYSSTCVAPGNPTPKSRKRKTLDQIQIANGCRQGETQKNPS